MTVLRKNKHLDLVAHRSILRLNFHIGTIQGPLVPFPMTFVLNLNQSQFPECIMPSLTSGMTSIQIAWV